MHRSTRLSVAACFVAALVVLPLAASAQQRGLEIRTFAVRADINGPLAAVTVDMVFVNYTAQAAEFTGEVALPEDAAVDGLALWVEGLRSPGELLPRVAAERIYREITQARRDPALLTYIAPGRWGLSVSPIPANGTQKVQFTYSHFLRAADGKLLFQGPTLDRKAQEMDFSADVRGGVKDLKPLQPSMGVQRTADGLRLGVRKEQVSLSDPVDFSCTFAEAAPEVFWHKSAKDGCQFVAILPAPAFIAEAKPRPRDYVLVVDTSESMASRWDACRKAAGKVLDMLRPEDQLAIVVVSSDVRVWKEKFVAANKASTDEAKAFINGLKIGGGTDLAAGLRAAGSYNTSGKNWLEVILLSDGCERVGTLPAEGESRPGASQPASAASMPSRPPTNCRLYAVSFGADALGGLPVGCTIWGTGQLREMLDASQKVFMSDLKLAVAEPTADFALTTPILSPASGALPWRAGKLILAGRWPDNRDKPLEMTISASLDLKDNQHKVTIQPPDAKGQGGAFPGEGLGRIWAHLRAIQMWQDMQTDKAMLPDLEKLIAFGKSWHIATPVTAFLVLEHDADYLQRGIRREACMLTSDKSWREEDIRLQAAGIQDLPEAKLQAAVYLRQQANDLVRLGDVVQAVEVYQKIVHDGLADFDDQSRLSVLQQFAALKADVESEKALKQQEREEMAMFPAWERALQRNGPSDLVPMPEGPRAVLPIVPLSLPGNAKAWKNLQIRLPKVDFERTEMADVMAVFQKALGTNYRVNWDALQAASVDRKTPVTVALTDVTIQQAMEEVLRQMSSNTRVTFAVDEIGVTVSTKDDLSKAPFVRVYDIRDIVSRMPNPRPRPMSEGSGPFGGPFGEANSSSGSFGSNEENVQTRTELVRQITDTITQKLDPSSWLPSGTPSPAPTVRVYDIRDLTVRVPNFAGPQASFGSSNEESVVTRAEGIKQVLDTITRSVEPNSWAPAGTVGSINDIRGLLFVTQTFENHVAVTHILNALKQGMKDIRPGAVPPEDWPESEYLFAPDGSIHPWVADLLDHAAKGKLSKFSSVEIAQAGDRKFANIGGYWLDVSLTVSHKILPLAPASAAMREVIKRRPGVDKALELGPYVVVAVGPEQAVSADRAGAASAQEPEVKKLLDSVKGQG